MQSTKVQPSFSIVDQPVVWIDLEMTGLDVSKDKILEIAVVVTDSSLKE
jgi:oligoribonuclease